ncbi:MAG: hypothetical protein AAFY72_02995 [Cyanobacteria bacterium J06649_4]
MEIIGFLLMLFGGLNMAWFLLWFLLGWSATLGAKASKKVGTANESTDDNILLGERFQREAFRKFAVSASMLIVGSLLTHFAA